MPGVGFALKNRALGLKWEAPVGGSLIVYLEARQSLPL
jgi:hypothetical protein